MGGGLANITACLVFNLRNGTGGNYTDPQTPLLKNYVFCTVAGVIAYVEFFFYGMGESQMGDFSFSSWPIHMAFIIVLSNVWGLVFREWKGTSRRTKFLLAVGLLALLASTLVIAYGSYMEIET
jgi:L-rhamnose-H+ transport protein